MLQSASWRIQFSLRMVAASVLLLSAFLALWIRYGQLALTWFTFLGIVVAAAAQIVRYPRLAGVVGVISAWVWLWGSPAMLNALGKSDAAAWVGLFLLPTAVLSSIAGGIIYAFPNRYTIGLYWLAIVSHLIIGAGSFL